ncbi:MAG: hypothetical protein ABIZ04_18105 [Opitutus sp.]
MARDRAGHAAPNRRGDEANRVAIPVGEVILRGDLAVPPGARGLVLFAHGTGRAGSIGATMPWDVNCG